MSVLNQSGDEPVECPLCMEQLEVDDLNFYPCTCGYQICRFCWHRIRTDENGLCPACRKAYPENPADFRPLTTAEVQRLKSEKRLREQQRKQKVTESRQHLASVRVVQKNLVFVVGLPMRLADSEVLKKHEYFGKFGRIHKVVINQSTAYAGSQGPSASAYVTYHRAEDTLRAIAAVNNIAVDGRTLKASLGTTKYCSHFMKNQTCPKTECMYLHELGDPEASFTKEDMQQGKHQEYEKKLHEQLVNTSSSQFKESPPSINGVLTSSPSILPPSNNNNNKEAWPSLQGSGREDEEEELGTPPPQQTKPTRQTHKSESSASSANLLNGTSGGVSTGSGNHKKRHTSGEEPRGRRRGRDKSHQNNNSTTNNNNNNNNGIARSSQAQSTSNNVVNGQKHHRHLPVSSSSNIVAEGIANKHGSIDEQSPSPPQSSSLSSSASSLSASTGNLAPAPLSSVSPPPPSSRSLSTSSSDCSSASSISEDAPQHAASTTQDALTDVQRQRAAIFVTASGREEQENQSFFSSNTHQFLSRPTIDNNGQWDQGRTVNSGTPPEPSSSSVPSVCATSAAAHTLPQQKQMQLASDNLLSMRSSNDWHAAFGFTSNHKPLPAMQNNRLGGNNTSNTNTLVEDELGFDPFAETQKALAEMIETEQQQHQHLHSYHQQQLQQQQQQCQLNQMNQTPPQLIQQHFPPQHLQAFRPTDAMGNRVGLAQTPQSAASRLMEAFSTHSSAGGPSQHTSRPPPPPGFTNSAQNNHMNPFGMPPSNTHLQRAPQAASKILPFMNLQQQQQHSSIPSGSMLNQMQLKESKETSSFTLADWHAILPNLGTGSSPSYAHSNGSLAQHRQPFPRTPQHKDWQNDWTAMDPAIVAATPLISHATGNESSPSSTSVSSLFPWVKTMYQPNNPHVHTNHNIASGWPNMSPSLTASAPPPPGFSHPIHASRPPQPTIDRPTIENL